MKKEGSTFKDNIGCVFMIVFIIAVSLWQFKDCGGKSKKDRFIESRMDNGSSRDEAEEEYYESAFDSQRR